MIVLLAASGAVACNRVESSSIELKQIAEASSPADISSISLSDDGLIVAIGQGASTEMWDVSAQEELATIRNFRGATAFGAPCVVAGLRGQGRRVELSFFKCSGGAPLSSWPVSSRPQNIFDQVHVVQVCGVVVARTLNGFIAVDWRKRDARLDLSAALPVHFDHLAAPKTNASCTMYALESGGTLEQPAKIAAIEAPSGKEQHTYRLGRRKDAEAPLLSLFANSAVSPSGKYLAIASYRRDLGADAPTWGFYRVEILDTETGEFEPELRFGKRGETVSSVVFVDDRHLLVATQGKKTLIYDLRTRTSEQLEFGDLHVWLMDYSPTAKRLAVASADKVRVYQLLGRN
ncbi:MAG: hypothetical protein GC190_21185 [Alphaproteobacteria bacterium]|nr:hypothetical protein [Alphaproteobacteria bacterium]